MGCTMRDRLDYIFLDLKDDVERLINFETRFIQRLKDLSTEKETQELQKALSNIDSKNFSYKEYGDSIIVENHDSQAWRDFSSKPENGEPICAILRNKNFPIYNQLMKDYRWLSNSLVGNIDTYINMYFRLIFDVKNFKVRCFDFNHNPKEKFFEFFPEYKGTLDNELDLYYVLHAIRNDILHNGTIVDSKLIGKLGEGTVDLKGNSDSNIHKIFVDFNKLVEFALMAFKIIYKTAKDIFLAFPLKDLYERCNNIIQNLKKYNEKVHPKR